MLQTVPHLVKCKVCENPFKQATTMHTICSGLCARRLAVSSERAKQRAEKAERIELKRRKEAVKPRAKWLQEAQVAFNAWIRARDAKLPCVSCGRHHEGQFHAGHYLSTGARPELRFHEDNVWKQCQPCNTHLHGNLVLFRAELIRRIGLEKVEWLEGPHEPKKYSIDELRDLRNDYRARLRAIQ